MDLSFEHRLLRFLDREEEGERRSSQDLRALPIEERVLEGECVQNAELLRVGAVYVFRVTENLSKFRPGDPVFVGDGLDFNRGCALVYGSYDPEKEELVLENDRFARGEGLGLKPGSQYCIDRRPLGLRGRLQQVVRSGFEDELIRATLEGTLKIEQDAARFERAVEYMRTTCLNEIQIQAGAAAIATESLSLVQGPPGTGKTRMLAEVLNALCSKGCRIALTAFTHRAVDNVLLALRRIAPDLPLFKVGNPGTNVADLRRAGVRLAQPGRVDLPQAGVVIAGTCFALARLPESERFHFAVFDEAGQLPVPHAIAGMQLARRWIFVGDHWQLPPVIRANHADSEVTQSVFERLHRLYKGDMLEVTYRMNKEVCAVVSETFYAGRLRSAPEAEGRRMPFVAGGTHDEVLDPEKPVVLARVDHLQPGMRSPEEANLVADLVEELVRRHGVPSSEIAVIAPFRSQVRAIRTAVDRKQLPDIEGLVIDTVERIQGQEREVVLVSLAVGDPDTLDRRASFFFSTNRLNVALSRARTKAVLVASIGAFRALPMDPDSLIAASVWKSLEKRLPTVDLTAVYAQRLS